MVLLKESHIATAGGATAVIEVVRKAMAEAGRSVPTCTTSFDVGRFHVVEFHVVEHESADARFQGFPGLRDGLHEARRE
jgi:hypothetical protein